MLPEHTNTLYKREARSSIALSKEVADKLNELIDAFNELSRIDLEWKHEQEGTVRGTALYIKDNLINVLDDFLDILVERGFINKKIEQYSNNLSERVSNLLGKVKEGSTTLDAEIIDIRADVNGIIYATAGEAIREQLTMLPIGLKAIEADDDLDLDHYTSSGNRVFTVYSGLQNLPDGFSSASDKPRYLVVECFGAKIPDLGGIQTWGRQLLYTENGERVFKRYFKWNYSTASFEFAEWKHDNANNNFRTITSGDADKIVEVDNYIIATGDLANMPFSGRGCLMRVHNFSYGWLVQEVFGLKDFRQHWYRIGNNSNGAIHTNNAEGLSVSWSKWEQVLTADSIKQVLGSVDNAFTNRGYIIANMGDSIIGNTQDQSSVSAYLENATGATCHNLGFGGGRMSAHDYQWDAFSMYSIANAIAAGDYSAMEGYASEGFDGMPSYFAATVAKLKVLDFSKVDIVTIGYGVNDFTGNKTLDNTSNKKDVNTFGGALRHSIETILTRYPNLRIVVVAPCWAKHMDGQVNANGNTLYDFVEKTVEIAREYHLPVVNPFDDMGINSFNASHWFADDIHPNATGRELAKLIANTNRGM